MDLNKIYDEEDVDEEELARRQNFHLNIPKNENTSGKVESRIAITRLEGKS
jgi:hypothetical protein